MVQMNSPLVVASTEAAPATNPITAPRTLDLFTPNLQSGERPSNVNDAGPRP
jgi:hypothetical protein